MSKLQLSVAVGNYDRIRPLVDGEVQIDGVDLAGSRRDLFSRLQARRLRYLRTLAQQLLGEDCCGNFPLHRGAGLSLASLSTYVPPFCRGTVNSPASAARAIPSGKPRKLCNFNKRRRDRPG
jgi:hypothetical protein